MGGGEDEDKRREKVKSLGRDGTKNMDKDIRKARREGGREARRGI